MPGEFLFKGLYFCWILLSFWGNAEKANRSVRLINFYFNYSKIFFYFFIKKKVSRETIINTPYLKIQYMSSKKFI